jgi:type I restriction enzyme S subunit
MGRKSPDINFRHPRKLWVCYMLNNNLLEQVLTLYRNKFVNTANNQRATCRADEYFDISIGKTPPRKEPQWFSTNSQDVTWVSISDMGTCGLYISSSSEQLTKQAVERHNVKVVPDNTVLLSFKLTVGRIAITNGEMTTNEAIAHFKTDKKEINEYLYCYLKCFNYQTMGSTSSIATAVNSKIIKGMPFVVPANDELEEFHGFAAPMFAKIKANQIETDNLTALRDTLLPKLMSGELDVSDTKL